MDSTWASFYSAATNTSWLPSLHVPHYCVYSVAHWHNGAQQTRSTKKTAICFIGTSQQPMLAPGEPGPWDLDGGLSGHQDRRTTSGVEAFTLVLCCCLPVSCLTKIYAWSPLPATYFGGNQWLSSHPASVFVYAVMGFGRKSLARLFSCLLPRGNSTSFAGFATLWISQYVSYWLWRCSLVYSLTPQ